MPLADKDLYSQGYGLLSSHVRMWELDNKEGRVLKNWCFWTAVLEKTRESLGKTGSNQSMLKEISPQCSLEGLMLKLKLHYFGHLIQRANSLEKILLVGKIEGRRKREQEEEMVGWHHWLNGHESEQILGRTEEPEGLQSMGSQRVRYDWVIEHQQIYILLTYKKWMK